MAGADVAEVARRHAEADRLVTRCGRREVTLEVVHHLRRDARPVDRVDGADAVASLERQVIAHRLDDVLTVVEHALDRNIDDVRVLQAEHLRGLETAHLAVRAQHEDAHTALAAHRIFGAGAGVAAGRAEDVERLTGLGQRVLEQVAEQLHRHVLKGECRAVGEFEQVQPRLQRVERSDLAGVRAGHRVAIHRRGVGAAEDGAQVIGRDVGDEARQHRKGQVGVVEPAHRLEFGGGKAQVISRHGQTTIGHQAAEQGVGEGECRRLAAGGDVLHGWAAGGAERGHILYVWLMRLRRYRERMCRRKLRSRTHET